MLITIVFIFDLSVFVLKLQAGEIEDVTKALLNRDKARTKKEIAIDIGKLEKALLKSIVMNKIWTLNIMKIILVSSKRFYLHMKMNRQSD